MKNIYLSILSYLLYYRNKLKKYISIEKGKEIMLFLVYIFIYVRVEKLCY